MKYSQFIAGSDDQGRRIDRVLRKILPNIPLSRIYTSLRTGFIKVNGKKKKPSDFLEENDIITIASVIVLDNATEESTKKKSSVSQLSTKNTIDTEHSELEILFENDNVMIINKPYNIAVQGGNKKESNIALLVSNLKKTNSFSLAFKPAPLHRLDKKTTGLLVVSQSIKGAQVFSELIREHAFTKEYLGIVEGYCDVNETWEDSLEKNVDNTSSYHTVKKSLTVDKAKKAITRVNALSHGFYKNSPVTLVRFTIVTGRTHQIRAQTSIHGYPLLGDIAYNSKQNSLGAETGQDFYLHAHSLQFSENNTIGLPTKITAPLNVFFIKMLELCLLEYGN